MVNQKLYVKKSTLALQKHPEIVKIQYDGKILNFLTVNYKNYITFSK